MCLQVNNVNFISCVSGIECELAMLNVIRLCVKKLQLSYVRRMHLELIGKMPSLEYLYVSTADDSECGDHHPVFKRSRSTGVLRCVEIDIMNEEAARSLISSFGNSLERIYLHASFGRGTTSFSENSYTQHVFENSYLPRLQEIVLLRDAAFHHNDRKCREQVNLIRTLLKDSNVRCSSCTQNITLSSK